MSKENFDTIQAKADAPDDSWGINIQTIADNQDVVIKLNPST